MYLPEAVFPSTKIENSIVYCRFDLETVIDPVPYVADLNVPFIEVVMSLVIPICASAIISEPWVVCAGHKYVAEDISVGIVESKLRITPLPFPSKKRPPLLVLTEIVEEKKETVNWSYN